MNVKLGVVTMENEVDLPIFLGVCESALVKGDGVSQNFYGVGDILPLPFFPQCLRGIFLLLGFPTKLINKQVHIIVRSKDHPEQKAWSDLLLEEKHIDQR